MQNTIYLKGLNAIRFLLAMLVVLQHSRQNLLQYEISAYSGQFLLCSGRMAVEFFFVLSGFILTHLAINELHKSGTLHLKHFFMRRILRIFPLYYLDVLLGYLLLGVCYPLLKGSDYLGFPWQEGLLYHLFLLPNFLIAKYNTNVGFLYALWSIGVEEQFYLFFPFLFPFVWKQKNAIMVILSITLAFFLWHYFWCNATPVVRYTLIQRFIQITTFYFMFLGCSAALVLHYYKDIIWRLGSNPVIYSTIFLLFLYIVVSPVQPYDPYHLLYGIVFCCLIYVVINPFSRISDYLEFAPLRYLGGISYGIYIFHPIISYPMRFVLEANPVLLQTVHRFPLLYYCTITLFTIGAAHLSFQYFESYFLRLKTKIQIE
jgi:peptidoglycan/LPS O-acetylase OafA/YrhL